VKTRGSLAARREQNPERRDRQEWRREEPGTRSRAGEAGRAPSALGQRWACEADGFTHKGARARAVAGAEPVRQDRRAIGIWVPNGAPGPNLVAECFQPGLEVRVILDLVLLRGARAVLLAGRGISRGRAPVRLRLVVVLDDALVVLLYHILRDALHAEDLDVQALAVR